MSDIPLVVTAAGPQPTPPAVLLAQLIALVSATNPGYTANLPGSLIEDISSTDVGALTIIDQARVETVNSLTPYAANAFLLNQLGQIYGVMLGEATNTSVFVVFEGPPGYVIAQGFTVSDGTYQYILAEGGIIASDGFTSQLFAVATQSGTWAVPADTVVNLITSVPASITLSVTNPADGVPGADSQSMASYRTQVLQAGLAASQGMSRYLKTLLGNVSGVQQRLIAARAQPNSTWEIIVGGGDPYEVAYAIFRALFDINNLVGSTINITGITQANPGVVTTDLNHGYSTGDDVTISDSDPVNYNGDYTAIVLTPTTFGLGHAYNDNVLLSQAWASTGGGTVTASTTTAHGVTVGSSFTISGSSPSGYNGTHTAISGTTGNVLKWTSTNPGSSTVLGQLDDGIANVDTSGYPTYTGDGICTPNSRNLSAAIQDFPDLYIIPFVNPPQQSVAITVTWNTTATNFVSEAAVAQLGTPALVDYVNAIFVGQPMILYELQTAFQAAIASVLPPYLLTRMIFAVSIDGIGVNPEAGTGIIAGDPESYFLTNSTLITITQG